MEKKEHSMPVRVSPVQHQHLRIMAAYKKLSLIRLMNYLIDLHWAGDWKKSYDEDIRRRALKARKNKHGK